MPSEPPKLGLIVNPEDPPKQGTSRVPIQWYRESLVYGKTFAKGSEDKVLVLDKDGDTVFCVEKGTTFRIPFFELWVVKPSPAEVPSVKRIVKVSREFLIPGFLERCRDLYSVRENCGETSHYTFIALLLSQTAVHSVGDDEWCFILEVGISLTPFDLSNVRGINQMTAEKCQELGLPTEVWV